jgi:hypothetical protein
MCDIDRASVFALLLESACARNSSVVPEVIMQPFAVELVELLRAHREAYIEITRIATTSNPGRLQAELTDQDRKQIVDGFLAVLTEALEDRGSDTRNFFLSTVIPGLVNSGEDISMIIQQTVSWSLHVTADVGRCLSDENRQEGVAWIAQFLATYTGDVARAGKLGGPPSLTNTN